MYKLFQDDCRTHIQSIGTVQAIITDPPYDMPVDEFMAIMNVFRRICTGNIIVFCRPENPFFKPDEYAYWIKQPSTKNNAGSKKLSRFLEWVLIERHGDTFNTDLHWSNYTGLYDDRLLTKQKHPYEKPLSLMKRLASIYTKPGDTILDPFMGSGTTGEASLSLDRDFIGMEINLEYFNLAESRMLSVLGG